LLHPPLFSRRIDLDLDLRVAERAPDDRGRAGHDQLVALDPFVVHETRREASLRSRPRPIEVSEPERSVHRTP
jgi:hypothetical protein